jgi:4-amino-4-deoxychorismate lyase
MQIAHTHILNGLLDHYISPFDRGFAYGDGVFRTLKIINGIPQHWPQHYQKLVADCAVIGIVCPSADLLIDDMRQLFSLEESAVAKITITRGEGERGYKLPAVTLPTRLVIKSKLPEYHPEYATNGVCLQVCETRLSNQPKLAGIKHLNRLENVIARMEWQNEAIFDGLLLNAADAVIECTMSNVFARFSDIVITPDLSDCGVAGITRQQIMQLAKPLNLAIQVGPIPLNTLLNADEIIICNSLYTAFQVTNIHHGVQTYTWKSQALAAKIKALITC